MITNYIFLGSAGRAEPFKFCIDFFIAAGHAERHAQSWPHIFLFGMPEIRNRQLQCGTLVNRIQSACTGLAKKYVYTVLGIWYTARDGTVTG